jgi:N-dimethylarginine dimethylaminohydrolase
LYNEKSYSNQILNKEDSLNDSRFPIALLNFPYSLSIDVPNNPWMVDELNEEPEEDEEDGDWEEGLNKNLAYRQWLDLYSLVVQSGAVAYLVPSLMGLQDQTYIANLGLKIPEWLHSNTYLLSNFMSEPRIGEDVIGGNFLKLMGYEVVQPPHKWEGEADLKFIGNDIFIGGYGIRSEKETYEWMMEKYPNMKIIPVKMNDPYLYHLDCNIFPIDNENVLVANESLEGWKDIEKHSNIIPIDTELAHYGICNSIRVGSMVITHTDITELEITDEEYTLEKKKIDMLNKLCANLGLELATVNLSEFTASGALASCLYGHLTWDEMNKSLV